jgi:hypothetical protein
MDTPRNRHLRQADSLARQAWRESNEIAGRTLMRGGEWLR